MNYCCIPTADELGGLVLAGIPRNTRTCALFTLADLWS